MKRTRKLLLFVALAGLVAACGGGSDDNADDGTTGTSHEAAEVDSSRAVAFYGTNVLTQWDPTKSVSQSNEVTYFTQVYDRLLQLQPDNTLKPALATEYEFAPDGLTLTMRLRDDVVFHDGGTFDAANAVANLDRNRATGSVLAPTLSGIAAVAATGPSEITITLTAPDPTILYRLASTSSSMVSPKGLANLAGLATAPAGSGPFKYVSFDGTTVTLERNDTYWDTTAEYPATKTIWAVTDDAARLNAVSSGAADAATVRAAQWAEVERLVAAGQVEAYQFGELGQFAVYVNGNDGPLADQRVRRAISMAIDRATINEALLNGLCAPSSQVVPKGFVGHDDDSPAADEFDPKAARALLDDAGVGPITLRTLVADGGQFADLGAVVQDQLADIGITLELTPAPTAQMRATWRTGSHDLMVFQFTPTTPDPISIVLNDYLGPDSLGAQLPSLQPLVDAATPLDVESSDRATALEDISAFLFENPLHVPICQVPGIYVYQPGLLGVEEIPGHRLSANVPDTRSVIWSR